MRLLTKLLNLCPPRFGWALQHRHLETAHMIEVDVERRLGKAMMVMEVLGQSPR
jgi:hypothetical protein